MKAKILIIICAAAFFAVSCGDGEHIVPEVPEIPEAPGETGEEDKPVIDLRAEEPELIMLGYYDTTSNTWSPVDKVEAKIVGGNGDYKIIYPEEIFCKYWGDESGGTVPYSEDIVKVWVEGDVVHVERVLPAYNPNGNGELLWLHGDFILEDGKGQQKTFWVDTLVVFGGLE